MGTIDVADQEAGEPTTQCGQGGMMLRGAAGDQNGLGAVADVLERN